MLKSFTEFSEKQPKKAKKKKAVKKTNEAVTRVNDEFKVKTAFGVSAAMLKEYIQKVKQDTGKNPLEFWSAADIAEEAVKYILSTYLKIDNLPASIVFGDSETREEQETAAENDDINVSEKPAEEDMTQDKVESDVEVEEEEIFGMAENLTDSDIKFYQ